MPQPLGQFTTYNFSQGPPPATPPQASPGNLQPSSARSGAGPYGYLPQVPNPITSQSTAIGGNTGNLASLYGLGTGLNTQIAREAAIPYNLNLPQYGSMVGQSSGNILSLLKGQVPQDVANQIAQMAAERGVSTGSIGSPNSNTALLRSLGLTSLGLQQQGEGELTGAIGRTPTGQQFNPSSFLVSPETMQGSQYLSNLLSAAPDPAQAGGLNILSSLAGFGMGGQAASGYRQPTYNPPTGGGGIPLMPSGGITPGLPAMGSGPIAPGPQYGAPGSFNAPPPSYGAPQPGDFEAMGFQDDQSPQTGTTNAWQTGMPLDNYAPSDPFSGDLFGSGDIFG